MNDVSGTANDFSLQSNNNGNDTRRFSLTCPRFLEVITFYYQDIAIIVLKGRLKISV